MVRAMATAITSSWIFVPELWTYHVPWLQGCMHKPVVPANEQLV